MIQHTNTALTEADQQHYLQVFKRFPLAMERGEGAYIWDVEGNKYLDLLAGIAVNSLGHCHPKVVHAISEQARKLMHVSNFFISVPQVQLAERLKVLSGLDRVFFTNSGAESVEGAIKIARKFGQKHDRSGVILSMTGSFHGRTLATIATGKKAMQKGFDPIPAGFYQVQLNDIDALKAAVAEHKPSGIIVEPIQGEGGINVASKEFLETIRGLCDQENMAMILDEVQCGIGRTGKWFAFQHFHFEPDIMTLAKALGGGFPVGAILTNEKMNEAMDFGDHGTTFGGNPLACAAALATLEAIENELLLEHATLMGNHVCSEVNHWKHPLIKEIRGKGLMLGIDLTIESKPIALELLEEGIIANATAETVIRIVPPLNIGPDELDQFLTTFRAILDKHQNQS